MRVFYIHRLSQTNPQAKKGDPIAVVATELNSKGEVAYAIASCSAQDTFDKKKGRIIAIGRLKDRLDTLPSFPKQPLVKVRILHAISKDEHWTNKRVRKAAADWIKNHTPWEPLVRQPEVIG